MIFPDTKISAGSFPNSETRETLHLRFASHYVTVRSASPEVTQSFRSSVALMMGPSADGTCVGNLEVVVRQAIYSVIGPEVSEVHEYEDPESAANRLFHAAIKLLMAARPDLLWIHGGVVARDERATLLCGPSGAGKSTLVSALIARGWTYFSDEFAVVDPHNATVFPFPIAPSMRINNGIFLGDGDKVSDLPKVRIETPAHSVGTTAVPIDGAFFLSYTPQGQGAQVVNCSPAEGVLEMLQNSLSTASSRDQEVRGLCALMSRVPSARLIYGRARDATDRIEARLSRS